MKKEAAKSIIRHALTGVGAVLVAQGIGDEAIVQEAIGVVIAIVGLAWSIIEKRRRQNSPTDSGQPQI